MALAAGGRHVSLEELTLWRKNGLLPPLASYGVRAQGRSYYWQEPDILARAELVYDALRKTGRSETATIRLWLHGFEVPLPRVKRAWLHRTKLTGPARVQSSRAVPFAASVQTLPELLLSATLHAAIAIECPPEPAMVVLKRAAAALGCSPGTREAETQLYWQTAMTVVLALGTSDVITGASDDEMLEAQRHLHVSLKFLSGYCRNESPVWMIDSLGPPLFLFILALLRSGQHSVIETVINGMATVRPAAPPRATQPSQAAVRDRAELQSTG